MKHLLEQYKQIWAGKKRASGPVVLDTITTRFLLLFLFLLTIPLVSVTMFTVSLLVDHMDDAANSTIMLSKNLLESTIHEDEERLALISGLWDKLDKRQYANATYAALCPPIPGDICLLSQAKPSQVLFQASTGADVSNITQAQLQAISPDFTPTLNQPLGPTQFFARWHNQLYTFHKNILPSVQGSPREVFRGYALDDNFLRRIYRKRPDLQTAIWILKEPLQPNHYQFLARSPQGEERILDSTLLNSLANLPANQSIQTLTLHKHAYRVYQSPVYSLNQEQIARIVHILPLTQNQLLLNQYYMGIYIIAVASLVFSVLLAMLAGRTITQPLLKLLSQVNKISRESVMKEKDEVVVSGVYEIRKLGEAFNHMIKRLRQEHKMKDEFVATLTHDLKVPMLAEKQTLSYFKNKTYGPLTEEQDEVIQILQSSNSSCLSLVNGLLEVYRYDAGDVSLFLEAFNLVKLLQQTVNELQPLAREKQISLDVASVLNTDEAAQVYADPLEIKRVLHNLVSNAITNTPPHGTIRCSVTDAQNHGSDTIYKVGSLRYTTLKYPIKLKDRLMVVIQDSGIGFTQEDLPFLFKQFAASRGRNPMSIGLGLYNCYQVIQAHNGVLWVESTEGEGAMVSFVLPHNKQTAQDRRVYHDRRRQS